MNKYRPAVEDYLKAIYHLAPGGRRVVGTKEVAQSMGVSSASVTNMFGKLHDLRLVRYRRYKGAALTARGERSALGVIRKHRIIETFLTSVLGYSWDQVDADAEQLEHAASDRFIDCLESLMDYPSRDPHGSPIPTRDGRMREPDLNTLAATSPGTPIRVMRIERCDGKRLRYLTDIGIAIGCELTIEQRAPFSGPVTVVCNGRSTAMAHDLAAKILVARVVN